MPIDPHAYDDADEAPEAGTHDVDRLHLREGEAQRLPPQEPGLDLQVVAVHPPARDEPRHEPEHDEDRGHAELHEVVLRLAAAEDGGHEQDRDRDRRAAAADDRRERMQPLPPVGVAHIPAACASPSTAAAT
jgi:hypothetical protein